MKPNVRISDLRQAIRCGQVDKALGLASKTFGQAALVEAALLVLLQFQLPDITKLNLETEDAATRARALMLQGIMLNRQRDPLGALAKFQEALQGAGSDAILKIDVWLETAKAYVWLGNSGAAIDLLLQALSLATQKSSQFLVFCRLSDLYAELERWQMARHYIDLAKAAATGLHDSIYYVQLLECEARVGLATAEDFSTALSTLQKREKNLPAYLQFRLHVLLVEKELAEQKISAANIALAKLQALPLCARPDSFENTVTQVLSARLDLLQENPKVALSKLALARDWFADEDLAVRLIDARLLLAKAYVLDGQTNAAAVELNTARDYCQSRGLSLQFEKIENSFADFNLTLYPVTESNRSLSGNWKNRQAYVILEKLGEGGQGSVFRAFDNARQKVVAFKKLKAKGAASLEALAREVRSANAAAIPNVARMIACGTEEDGSLYMVQEFVNGKSLRALMLAGEKPAVLLQHLAAVAQILNAIHAKGVVHGDVKPENILVTAEGKTVLVDFGLARVASRDRAALSGATAHYAPPSLAAQFRSAQWRDQFALGVMLNECAGPHSKLARKLMRPFVWPFAKTDYAADWEKLVR